MNIGVNAGFTRSQSSSSSHTEGAAVTTLKPMDENSSITYSNVNNITYEGTQAQGGTFIYNNVANIQKEAVEFHNSYSSSSSSRGINAGATIGYGHKLQTTGNGGSISASQSNQNTVETVYANGNFKNVNEVHNNTGSMVLNGFNQEGGKVTGNIGKLVVESRQNTSTTTGRSSGASVGISANGVPSSLNVNGNRTSGSRAFVDNQSSFIVGEGSNLHVGTVENTGAIIGKQSENGTTFKVDKYVGHDIQNYDTMTTTGISVGTSLGKSPRVTNIGFNQDDRDKQGITRNTVVGNVEIGEASGSPINRDVTKANEVTKDVQHSTNVNVESQTIEYATNPGKLKEDLNKAKDEIKDVTKALDNSIHDPGDDNRNFFGQLRETRLSETVENIAGERLKRADNSEDVVSAWKDAYKDLGYNLDVKYTTGEDTPEMKNKAGTAYISKDGVHTIIININAEENSTKAGLIGTLAEEASHIVNGVAGRQIETGTEEKGLESTGRAANAYFKEEYKGSNQNMTYKSDGKIDTSKLGTNVGDELRTTPLDQEKYDAQKKDLAFKQFIRDMIQYLKDKNGKYDFEFLEKIKNKLDELIDEKVLLKEIDKAQEESILMEVLNNIDKDNYSILDGKINSKKINSDDILKNNYEKAIAAENKTAIITITQKDDLENEKIKDFFAFFENELKENNKISQKDKNKILDKYKNSFKNINNNIFFNDESETNLILINKDSEKLKYVTYSYKNDVPVSLIGTESNNIGANISHEIAHFDDAITEEIVPLKHNENEKIYRSKEGGYYYIYSSNNYTINEKFNTITFYPVWEREYNSIFIENEYKKRVSKDLPRVYYGDYDGGMFKTVDFNGNIEKAFEKMIKTRIEEKNEK